MAWLNIPNYKLTLSAEQLTLFNEEVRKKQIQATRFYTILILLLSLIFIVPDYYFLPEYFYQLMWIRVCIVMICVMASTFIKSLSVDKAFLLLASALIAYNLVIVYIGILAANNHIDTYQQGTVLLIVYSCTLFQAPLFLTCIITIICWLSYLIGALAFSQASLFLIMNNTFLFIIASCLGLLSVIHREQYLLANFLSEQKLKAQEQFNKNQALHDALTKLPNRLSILEKLEHYSQHIPKNMVVMMADVDNFKKLNDEYGHKQGDLALQLIAQNLSQLVNAQSGFVSRYGGEEFMIIIEDSSISDCQTIGEQLVQSVKQIRHHGLPAMSISIGGYLTTGQEKSINDCIERADQTLLKAKKTGKDQFLLNQRAYKD